MTARSTAGAISAHQISAQLQRILASDGLRRADHLASFLTYAVEETLAGRGSELKEYSIGVNVFNRGADFDGRVDPIVRVQARNLRTRIDEYYATVGSRDKVVIEFEKGTYAPAFRLRPLVEENPQSKEESLAVLPFTDLTEEPGFEYFSDGLTEELIGALSRIPGLLVAARTSVYAFKGLNADIRQIGARLGVTYILEGSIRRSVGQLRVSVQLIEVSSGFHKWSETMAVPVDETFAMQQRIAESVAHTLRLLQGQHAGCPVHAPQPCGIDAYEAYLKARYHWSRRTEPDVRAALRLYEQSIAADSSFSQAYSGLADCYMMLAIYGYLPPVMIVPRAKQLALKALELDPRSAEAHTAIGMIAAMYDWNHDAARKSFLRAIECRPSYPDAHQWYASVHLCTVGRLSEAVLEFETALRCDPLSTTILGDLANTISLAGRHEEGIEACLQVIAREPQSFRIYWQIGLIYERMGRIEDALRAFELCCSLSVGNPFENNAIACFGHSLAIAGRTEEAHGCLSHLERLASQRPSNPLSFALLYTGLGDSDRAFEWLNRAADARIGPALWIAIDPRAAHLRDDPRFLQLMVKFGLAD